MIKQSRCTFCGEFFRPDVRVALRQKSCWSKGCKAKRKRQAQKRWVKANPDYFRGRYPETRRWRVENPLYQQRWRAKCREIQDEIPTVSPSRTIRLVLPEKRLTGEIQDEIRLLRHCACGLWHTG